MVLVLCLGLVAGIVRSGNAPWHQRAYEGSIPARSLRLPGDRLAASDHISPRFPSPDELHGSPMALVVTCLSCRSGDVLGGFLGRMGVNDVPSGIDLRVVAIDGDPAVWRRTWGVPNRWKVHVAKGRDGVQLVRQALRTGESGQLQIYDSNLRWRASWHLGQLNIDGVRHDLSLAAS